MEKGHKQICALFNARFLKLVSPSSLGCPDPETGYEFLEFIWEVIPEVPGGEWGSETGKGHKPVLGVLLRRLPLWGV